MSCRSATLDLAGPGRAPSAAFPWSLCVRIALGVQDFVTVYTSSNLDDIPASERSQWDLVVGNPPHFAQKETSVSIYGDGGDLRAVDHQWQLHRGFYANLASFLALDGISIVVENSLGSTSEDFLPMLPDSLQQARRPVAWPDVNAYVMFVNHTAGY
jgi:hypothetical protein